ncbi:MAG: multifunctional 2-oxoglutarate metabolism enzyme, partial [Pseudonocardiales bacterium]|nr:multifunctional 2-oxoglutarate metabolism enzyme [Pseudonocardiales bacterium]
MSTSSSSAASVPPFPTAQFGTHEWLVEEMYQRFLDDPTSVDPAWHDFFADYRPSADDYSASQPSATKPTIDNGSNGQVDTTASTAPASAPTGRPGTDRAAQPTNSTATNSTATNSAPAKPAPTSSAPANSAPANSAPAKPGPAPASTRPAPASQPASPTKTSGTVVGTEAKPAAGTTSRAAKPAVSVGIDGQVIPLRGAANAVVKNMNASLSVPTATSVRAVPAKLLADNRIVINNQLKRTRGGKLSFTHLIGYAVVKALADFPGMNKHFVETDGKPTAVSPTHVNLGLAIDLPGKDGQRSLVVASIKGCEAMNFAQFWSAYEDMIRKARTGSLKAEDFAGTTISLTNPGTLGTNHSVPRLMAGQGTIVGVGAMEYPASFQGASNERLAEFGVSKIITLTSTYDHRIIQGAESGDFLRRVHQLLLGEDDFYDEIFTSLRVPYEPVRWVQDFPEGAVDKTARVLELIESYRTRGHLMADTDPLNYRQRRHPDLDVLSHGLTLWDLDREFATGGFAGKSRMKLRDVLGVLRDAYCRTVGTEYMHISDPEQRAWLQ